MKAKFDLQNSIMNKIILKFIFIDYVYIDSKPEKILYLCLSDYVFNCLNIVNLSDSKRKSVKVLNY